MANLNSGKSAATAYLLGVQGQSVQSNGNFAKAGDAQVEQFVLRNTTTNATVTSLLTDGVTSTAKIKLVPNSAINFLAQIIGRDTAGNVGGYSLSGVIKQGANAAATAIVGTVNQVVKAEDTASWDATAIADTTNGALDIQVTGVLATNIKWVAVVQCTEVAF